jgi:glycosyltransferase involved in cell wall biosynthesis
LACYSADAMANPERILLFIPMYNCEAQISRVLSSLDETATSVLDTILVINNRSTDGGEGVAVDCLKPLQGTTAQVLRNDANYGLGGSHKVAFQYAIDHGFDWAIVLHGDDQGQLSDLLPRILAGEHREVDCLLGARFHPESKLPGYSAFRTFGNHVFNTMFSVVLGTRLYDLGSGLNMYRVDILKDRFYLKFTDDLTFNYCMTMAHAFLGHRVRFFPIVWREDDQISNVRLFSQARRVLGLLTRFGFGRRAFVEKEHRLSVRDAYTAQVVGTNDVQA